jgi:hypothetical protein
VNYTNYKSTIMVHFKSTKVKMYDISVLFWVHCALEVVCLRVEGWDNILHFNFYSKLYCIIKNNKCALVA